MGRSYSPFESTRVFVDVIDQQERTLVRIHAPVLLEVPLSGDLYKHVALHSVDRFFGALGMFEKDGIGTLVVDHTLLGDFLDPEELKSAIAGVATAANDLDDELQKQFGGKRFADLAG